MIADERVLIINKKIFVLVYLTEMSSKATPIDHLPNSSSQGNVQMQMQAVPEQQSVENMPPQPYHPNQTMPDGNQMYQQMSMDQEGHRENTQNNYMSRQFVQPPGNMGRPPPEMYPPQGPCPGQMPHQMQRPPTKIHDDDVDPSDIGIFQLLMMQSKTLAVVFALLVIIQLETSQGIFRNLTRMVKVPDTMVFTVSKVFSSLIGVIIFFFVYRNL